MVSVLGTWLMLESGCRAGGVGLTLLSERGRLLRFGQGWRRVGPETETPGSIQGKVGLAYITLDDSVSQLRSSGQSGRSLELGKAE